MDEFDGESPARDPAADAAGTAERQVSAAGGPLRDGTVVGVLFAPGRTAGPCPHASAAVLGSLAAFAATAAGRPRPRRDRDRALTALRRANEELRKRAAEAERAVAAYDRAMDIVLRGGGVQEVVTAAGDRLGGELAVFDELGTPLAWTPRRAEAALPAMRGAANGGGPAGRDRPGGPGGCGAVARGDHWVAELAAGAGSLGTLVWAPPAGSAGVDAGDRRVLEGTAVVASLLRRFDGDLAAAAAKVRGDSLDDLLSPGPRTSSALTERALRIGYRTGTPHTVVVAHVDAERRWRLTSVACDLAAAHDGLSTVRDGRAVLVLPCDDPAAAGRRVSRSLTARLGAPVTAGAAGPVDDPAGLPAAYEEALACARALLRLNRAGAAATAAELGYAGLLLADGMSAADFVERTLGAVIRHDERRSTALLKTLETYFATGHSLAAGAKRLHVHPNTVTQRLDRAKRLLGVDWSSPDQALDVQLALRLHRLCRDLDD